MRIIAEIIEFQSKNATFRIFFVPLHLIRKNKI